jgi:hypothetical protein
MAVVDNYSPLYKANDDSDCFPIYSMFILIPVIVDRPKRVSWSILFSMFFNIPLIVGRGN